MKRTGHLFEQVVALDTLLLAARKALRGKKRRRDGARFFFHLETEVVALHEELATGTWQPGPYHTFVIHEPKRRVICAAPLRDRVVHHTLCHVLDPLFERGMIFDTYACRRGKGTHAALRRAQHFARRYPYVLKADIRAYFASIDHGVLKALLLRLIKDRRVLALLDRILDHPIPDGTSGRGLPIGNLTSQYFANSYLGLLDHFLKDRCRLKGYVRYMDDLLLFADDKPTLHTYLAAMRTFVQDTLRLELKEEALQLTPVIQGIPFLGFRVFPHLLRLPSRKWARFRRQVRQLESAFLSGMLSEDKFARRVASRIAHASHADTLAARRVFFSGSLVRG